MNPSTHQTKIFLSSTFVDLANIRLQISEWLSGILGANLVVMESLGSDASPPRVNSVTRVRECDLFVGVYAHRYGTVDPASGKSITELELDEARVSFSSGTLRNILLYVIDENSSWLVEHKESTSTGLAGIQRLREKANNHTWTRFESSDQLLFLVFRDIYRELEQHFGNPPLVVRELSVPASGDLTNPVGMEFLTSVQRPFLIGRDGDVDRLLERLEENPLVLLLGDSGV